MDSARWERIQELFHAAAERPQTEHAAFLEGACADDQGLKAAVMAKLEGDLATPSLLDQGLPEEAYLTLDALESFSLHEIGPYRLKKILGEGGMGVVWLAEREDTGTQAAIKVLPCDRDSDRAFMLSHAPSLYYTGPNGRGVGWYRGPFARTAGPAGCGGSVGWPERKQLRRPR